MRHVLLSMLLFSQTPSITTQDLRQLDDTLTTRDIGSLRVILKSVLPVSGASRLRCTFVLENRDAQKPVAVALNAEGHEDERGGGVRFGSAPKGVPLRSSIVETSGGDWTLSSSGIGGIGYVRAGVHGRRGREAYSPMEITRLLRLRDELGRETDDPSDGEMGRGSRGEGGSNVTFGGGRITSPERFFPNRGNRFVSGTMTTIEPGRSTTVTMDFRSEHGAVPGTFVLQLTTEIVVGVAGSYALHNLSFDGVEVTR